ncbi:MAG: tetratricopeptide repeat protein [Candidatus Eisenbacteria bacterium]|nr:tetratricopeptide repeat protein [Candidatus Eisenbacteria bacterium]
MPEVRLSLCMIVKNEEVHMRECLAMASEFVDEMIVVDTGSTDRTAQIARDAGARVSGFAWTGDFAAARNASLAQATGDWVLYLDADERIDFFNGARLRRFLENADEYLPAMCLRIESEARHRHSGVWLSHYYPRVFRRLPGVRFEGALHEQVIGPDGPLAAAAQRVPVVIRHLGYADPQREPARRARNLAIVEEEARLRSDDPMVQRNLANALMAMGEYERARGLFRRLLEAPLPAEFLQQAHWNLCICALETGRNAEALEAIGEDDRTQCGMLLRAEAARRSGDPTRAAEILTSLLESPPPPSDAVMDFHAEPVHVRVQLALCERIRGYPARARAHLEAALRLQPNSAEALLELASLDEVAGELESARAHLEKATRLTPHLPEGHLALARVLMGLGRPHEARAALASGAAHVPGNAELLRLQETMDEDELVSGSRVTGADLSVCMIVRDARPSLERALASVRGVADEIVVVDTGSVDGTPDLARAMGAAVITTTWDDDFSAPRNLALSHARGPWVLVLDADEELDPDSVDELRALLRGGRWDAAEVVIANRMRDGEAVSGVSHHYCRVFRKLPGVAFEGRVHEQVLPSLVRGGARLARSNIRILHAGYGLDAQTLRVKQERNLRLLHREIAERPGDRFLLFHLGVTLFALGRNADAVIPLEASLHGRSLPPEALSLAHVKLAQIALAEGNRETARSHLDEAEAARPNSALVTYLRAGIEFMGRDYQVAAELLGRLLASGQGLACEESLDEGPLRLDHGNCLYYLGRFGEAVREYMRAAELQPESALARYNLGNALYQSGRYGEALQSFDRALSLDPGLQPARHNAWQCTLRIAEQMEREGRDLELAALGVVGAPRELRTRVAAARIRAHLPGEALELLEELFREDSGDPHTEFLRAVALREAGRVAESLKVFERLTPQHASDAQLLSQYALALLAAGREDEAAGAYERALAADPSLAGRAAA